MLILKKMSESVGYKPLESIEWTGGKVYKSSDEQSYYFPDTISSQWYIEEFEHPYPNSLWWAYLQVEELINGVATDVYYMLQDINLKDIVDENNSVTLSPIEEYFSLPIVEISNEELDTNTLAFEIRKTLKGTWRRICWVVPITRDRVVDKPVLIKNISDMKIETWHMDSFTMEAVD